MLDLDAIVIDAASGGVEVIVETQAEIDQISNALSNGTLNLLAGKRFDDFRRQPVQA